jgi:hypothetical protein
MLAHRGMWTAFWTVSALATSAGLGVLVARVSLGLVLRAVDAASGRSGKRRETQVQPGWKA